MSQAIVHRGAFGRWTERIERAFDGGEEVIAPRVPPVPAKPTQAEQDEHHTTGHAAYRSWCEHCVKGRGRASPHAVASEGELPEVAVDYAYHVPEGHECLCSSFLQWMAARIGMENDCC